MGSLAIDDEKSKKEVAILVTGFGVRSLLPSCLSKIFS